MPITLCIEDYNRHMGGVDIADQLRSYYDTQLTSFRAWRPMLFWAYDTMITIAYIIFKDMPRSPDAMTHEEFRRQCAWGLILAGAEQVSTSQASRSTKPKSVHLNVKEDTSLSLGRSCDCGRFPVHFEGGKRLGVGFAAERRGRTQQKTQSFYQ